jgi:hypothetical protein
MANCFSKEVIDIEESSPSSSSSSSSLLPYLELMKTKNNIKIEKIQNIFHEEYKKKTTGKDLNVQVVKLFYD